MHSSLSAIDVSISGRWRYHHRKIIYYVFVYVPAFREHLTLESVAVVFHAVAMLYQHDVSPTRLAQMLAAQPHRQTNRPCLYYFCPTFLFSFQLVFLHEANKFVWNSKEKITFMHNQYPNNWMKFELFRKKYSSSFACHYMYMYIGVYTFVTLTIANILLYNTWLLTKNAEFSLNYPFTSKNLRSMSLPFGKKSLTVCV